MTDPTSGFMRHIRLCQNAELPGDRLPFHIGTRQVGWLKPDFAKALTTEADLAVTASGVTLPADRAGDLPAIARTLSEAGWFRWRGEAFDVRPSPDDAAITSVDRGAVPSFGILSQGVHLNGLVRCADGLYLWVARRAADKLLDPGKLDHLVAGGISAEMGPGDTLLKEAGEEAAVPEDLAALARPVGRIRYDMERPEGLRRDLLHCYDLDLPEGFTPRPADGEVEAFELWPIADAMAAVSDGDRFKFNVNLVLIDLFLREGLMGSAPEADALRRALTGNTP
ncbi:NUDIX hydrolase [Acidisoma cladoniae]|jgi:hypothetical protein|uniref:NUDIX hydrolase n=1 Tax=Acidisoma cladoniae TaxID=3040935 RepID=UPI00254C343F|nr:DUF4743 domain-containing protein [Acidisoma sp. PAMC 29798]